MTEKISNTEDPQQKPRYLVIGSGGREHALCDHLLRFGYPVECAPGSDALSQMLPTWKFDTFDELVDQIRSRGIEKVIVGPEKYLAEGIADFLERHQIDCIGPRRFEAKLETDKAWAKQFCQKYKIPTAAYSSIRSIADFESSIEGFSPPYVVKASGLAAGKGVWIGDDLTEARSVAESFLQEHESIVLEEFIQGRELSVFYAIDGDNYCLLGDARDHKRLLEKDHGPNTGGMGVLSPSGLLDSGLSRRVEETIVEPVLKALKRERLHYRGFLFLGLMLRGEDCFLLEFNCRMGDPETQALLLRMETPLPEIFESLQKGERVSARLSSQVALGVVVAGKDYPYKNSEGLAMKALSSPPKSLKVYHSGTSWDAEKNAWSSHGGRLFSACSLQESKELARMTIYPWIESLDFQEGITYRRDIGE